MYLFFMGERNFKQNGKGVNEKIEGLKMKGRSFKVTKAIDLIKSVDKMPEPKMLWRGIPEGSVGLISGVGKTGKTRFAENLAISMATGKKSFFNYEMDGKPKKVLFINLEESYIVRSRRNSKQIKELNKEEFKLFCENYYSTPEKFYEFINNEDDWKNLHSYILDIDPEVVFIDSLTHMFSGVIENSTDCRKFAELCKKYLFTLNKTIIIIHHNIKGNDKPIEVNNVAGSRVILQLFEFVYGLENIPTEKGGSYMCMLLNKHIEKDDITAYLYKNTESGWVEYLGTENKYRLYNNENDNKYKKDGRIDNTNAELIYDYMVNLDNQGNQGISTSTLRDKLVHTETPSMSNDTLFRSLKKLEESDKILKVDRGLYKLKNEGDQDEARM